MRASLLRLLGLCLMMVGTLMALLPVGAIVDFFVILQPYGGVPWSLSLLQLNLLNLLILVVLFAGGLTLVIVGLRMLRRRRPV